MTDYITQNIKFHQEISDEIFEDIYYIINDKINEFGLTLANPIRRHYNIIEYDISLNDDADTIGSCITEISDSINKKFSCNHITPFLESINEAYLSGVIDPAQIKEYHGIITNQ